MELNIESEKPLYDFGDAARFTVTMQFDGPTSSDAWFTPTVWQLDDKGKPVAPDQYPDCPMHESDDDTKKVGWFLHPVHRGRWGTFRAEALVYEPERHEIGTVYVDFEVRGPKQ